MNKRGIMLEFLVGVILALLIFTPTCLFTAKIFRLSQQGQDNFQSFVQELNDLSKTEKGGDHSRISVLTLDEETALVYFPADKVESILEIQDWQTDDYWDKIILGEEIGSILAEVLFVKPHSCTGNCLCLFQKYSIEGKIVDRENAEAGLLGVPQAVVSLTDGDCKTLGFHLEMDDCDFGPYEHADPESEPPRYACKGGFVIERQLVKKIDKELGWKLKDYHVLPRRISINQLKTPDAITLTSEIPQLPSVNEEKK